MLDVRWKKKQNIHPHKNVRPTSSNMMYQEMLYNNVRKFSQG